VPALAAGEAIEALEQDVVVVHLPQPALERAQGRLRRDTNVRRDFFGDLDDVPHHVITQGIGTILESRHVVLIATGRSKASPVARAVEGPLAAIVPASALQLHPHATVVVDEEAAEDLTLVEYYRGTWANKPPWQRSI